MSPEPERSGDRTAPAERRLHAAIVMDGNGRWATRQGLPRAAGHRAGARALRRIVEAAPDLGLGTLTLYAFSADNWRRPSVEVAALMQLFARYFEDETPRCLRHGIRVVVVGRRDRLAPELVRRIGAAEAATVSGSRLTIRVALDYSARDGIRRAALALATEGGDCTLDRFAGLLASVDGGGPPPPPVDLLIRTGGEQRLSDFLLWESAYAELVFRTEMWPEFTPTDLADCLAIYRRRERRFGSVTIVPPTRAGRHLRVIS